MRIPTIRGLIDRRILVNFIAEPAVIKAILPSPFSPKLFKGKAIAGICLIRLKQVRPKGLPAFMGISSENGAHRIAVEWTANGKTEQGVYIPRRDTSSRLNAFAGGRIFPGIHHLADFDVKEGEGHYHIAFKSSDNTSISVDAHETRTLQPGSIFSNTQEASTFFEGGSLGYSPARKGYDGLILKTFSWQVTPLTVSSVHPSFFENKLLFPEGSVQFDNALLMTKIEHEWNSADWKSDSSD